MDVKNVIIRQNKRVTMRLSQLGGCTYGKIRKYGIKNAENSKNEMEGCKTTHTKSKVMGNDLVSRFKLIKVMPGGHISSYVVKGRARMVAAKVDGVKRPRF